MSKHFTPPIKKKRNVEIHYKNSVIYQYRLDGVFVAEYQSCQEAGKKCFVYPRSIEKCCRGETNYSGEWIWKRVPPNYPKTNIDPVTIRTNPNNKPVRVKQLSPGGEFIQEFNSLLDAAKKIGIDSKAIRQVLRGKQKHAGGFRWEKA